MNSVAIVGGGPAGLMAADVVSAAGVPVTIYERMPSLGRKFLMAGRGGLNLTHGEPAERLIGRYGGARSVLEPLIAAFPPAALVAWVNDLGLETFVGSSGRVFPRTLKASPLLRACLARLAARGVEFRVRHRWVGIDQAGRSCFETADGHKLTDARAATVLALGGGSWPRLGSQGDWVEPVTRLGIEVHPLSPSNAGVLIAWSDHFRHRFAGQPVKRIRIGVGAASARAEAVITATGLEGGAIYALAPHLRALLERDGRAVATIDLRPDVGIADLTARLERPRGKQSVATWLRKSAQLSPVEIGLLRESAGAVLPANAGHLAHAIKALRLEVMAFAGLERAISSAGGIALDAVNGDMMLCDHPGIFVAGEMLDWEAPTGGYLLQACFSTGHAAGQGVLRYLGRPQRRF